MKIMTLRLPDAQAEELGAVARVDGVPVSEAIRDAITAHIASRRKDQAFRERLEQMMHSNREVLERLAQ